MTDTDIAALKNDLNPDWILDAQAQKLTRTFTFKAYAKAVYTANLAAFISDQQGHHADVAFGWGYCTVTFTSHELGRLSPDDFICAAKLDAATA
ncbi:4a-hydroxytetrahydrobiopterin dehydratase [Pacificibacter maritimus]|uniref:4a-hydroxytetrahydrobiopterin dehydratase n=1 Tax=Pacificibacter maritimus TaxID=762213 RepID=A0A3N4U9J6_9RHOB|nr:4a-hydroxytetrahydrobiopterin dehydratase [Pacificibacter maritimus]RPE67403.1 4a-hydroxytetrahydrobiopterin dehydratase [Pacificibacter maritimus]